MLRQEFLERLDDRAHFPHENTRIPEKLTALQKGLRQFEIGFLGETLHLADGSPVRNLDISVPRVGTRRFDPHGHQRIVRRSEFEAFADDRAEVGFVENQVIRRRDDHFGLGIALGQRIGGIGDAGRRIASDRFAQHLLLADFGQMLQYEVLVTHVGHHEEVLGRHHRSETLESVPNERFARPQNIEELLGHRLPALGPEPRSDASGHDYTIFVIRHKSYLGVGITKIKIFS